jgi:hypothetical protein
MGMKTHKVRRKIPAEVTVVQNAAGKVISTTVKYGKVEPINLKDGSRVELNFAPTQGQLA